MRVREGENLQLLYSNERYCECAREWESERVRKDPGERDRERGKGREGEKLINRSIYFFGCSLTTCSFQAMSWSFPDCSKFLKIWKSFHLSKIDQFWFNDRTSFYSNFVHSYKVTFSHELKAKPPYFIKNQQWHTSTKDILLRIHSWFRWRWW